jgi:hypothetical protein
LGIGDRIFNIASSGTLNGKWSCAEQAAYVSSCRSKICVNFTRRTNTLARCIMFHTAKIKVLIFDISTPESKTVCRNGEVSHHTNECP